jgi:hypothetical protein
MAEADLSGTVATEGAKTRVQFTHGDGNIFADDSVAITTDGGKTVTVIDPGAKTFFTLPAADLASGAGGTGLPASAPLAKVTDAGAGPDLAGFPTRHLVIDASYDVELGALRAKMHMTIHGDVWITNRIPAAESDFIGTKVFHTGFPEVDRVIDAESVPLRGGFALKESVVLTAKAAATEYHVATTVRAVAPAEFAVPAGYARVESPLEKLKAP